MQKTYYRKSDGTKVLAEQFFPDRTRPTGMTLWEKHTQPRDMSFGFVRNADGKMKHILHGDWIIMNLLGDIPSLDVLGEIEFEANFTADDPTPEKNILTYPLGEKEVLRVYLNIDGKDYIFLREDEVDRRIANEQNRLIQKLKDFIG